MPIGRHGDQKAMAESKRNFNLVGGFKHGFYFPIVPFHIWDVILPSDFHSIIFQDGHIAPPSSKAQLCAAWSPATSKTNHDESRPPAHCTPPKMLHENGSHEGCGLVPDGLRSLWHSNRLAKGMRYLWKFICIHDLSVYLCVINGRSFIVAIFFWVFGWQMVFET